jgi:cation-transporting P-type ATPase I
LSRAVLREFDNPLTPILAAGAGISLATGALADAMLVVTVMGGNAAVGGLQRFRTDRSMAVDVPPSVADRSRLCEGGEHLEVPAGQLVVGDVILLRAGETVPADCRILEAHGVEVDEASLTGESATVVKHAVATEASSVADRTSMLYAGTSLAVGEARGVVVATGRNTESRRGLAFVQADPPAAGVEARLESLTAMTAPLAIAGGATLAASGLLHGRTLPSVLGAGVSLAVAAVPEGLPLLATVAQLGAARRLAARGVLTRNPRAIEALGRTNVLCADKTGTLTEGRLVLAEVGDGVTATTIEDAQASHRNVLLAARRATPIRPGQRLPHPTDRAIAHGTAAAGVQRQDGAAFTVVHELPFEPARGYHAVLADTGIGRLLSVKGAPETVLDRCTSWDHPDGRVELDVATRISLHDHADTLARRGLRVLAVAHAPRSGRTSVTDQDVDGLILAGFVGLVDPIRPTAREAVAGLRRAGVDVVMITGDHPTTARGIGEKLGLITGPDQLMIGTELGVLDDEALDDRLSQVTVFARVTPADKVRIVRALQRLGKTVAMTGDGANDARGDPSRGRRHRPGKHATTAAQRSGRSHCHRRAHRDTRRRDSRRPRALVVRPRRGRRPRRGQPRRDRVHRARGHDDGSSPDQCPSAPPGERSDRRGPGDGDCAAAAPIARDIDALLREGPDASLGTALDSAIAWRAIGTASGATVATDGALVGEDRPRAHTVSLVALVGAQLGQTLAAGVTDPRVLVASAGSMAALITIVQTPGLSQMFGSRPTGPGGWLLGLRGQASARPSDCSDHGWTGRTSRADRCRSYRGRRDWSGTAPSAHLEDTGPRTQAPPRSPRRTPN